MDKKLMWAFQICDLVNRTKAVQKYSETLYPNRVGASYVCSMHAKFEVTKIAAQMNYFHTTVPRVAGCEYLQALRVRFSHV